MIGQFSDTGLCGRISGDGLGRRRHLARSTASAIVIAILGGCTAPPAGPTAGSPAASTASGGAFLIVLGIAQDGGAPQAGTKDLEAWSDPAREQWVASLALVEPGTGRRYLFDATPDLRRQLARLDAVAPDPNTPGLDGVFLTHAHMGHYTGLLFFGFESMGARGVPVYAMPKMAAFLETNGPWNQLVRLGNIELRGLEDAVTVDLGASVTVTPVTAPHRQEYSEVVGFKIAGPTRTVLYLPDIDSWAAWDDQGTPIEEVLATVDVAYLDGTFWNQGEIPGRDMSGFPHPMIVATMNRLGSLPAAERDKVRFIHLNHTNPALREGSAEAREVRQRGFRIAAPLERVEL